LRHFEKPADARKGRLRLIEQARIETCVHAGHVGVEYLKSEVLLVPKVMIERSFGRMGRVQQCLNTKTVIALLQQHAQARIDQALLG
jgi:hypothetical protein